jgi:hypothetical protein
MPRLQRIYTDFFLFYAPIRAKLDVLPLAKQTDDPLHTRCAFAKNPSGFV